MEDRLFKPGSRSAKELSESTSYSLDPTMYKYLKYGGGEMLSVTSYYGN